MKLITVKPSSKSDKKYEAHFKNGDKTKVVHFGGKNYMDYIKYSQVNHQLADEKRLNYIKRHDVNEVWSDPTTPGTLSRYILWEKRTLPEAIKAFKSRFNV